MQKPITIIYNNLDIRLVIGNLNINVLYIDYEVSRPSWHYDSHSHSSYELHLVSHGKGLLKITEKEFEIRSGSFYLTGPGVLHEQKADNLDPMNEYCINFEISFSTKKYTKKDFYIKKEVDEILEVLQSTDFWFGRDVFDSAKIFDEILRELENNYIGHCTYVQSLITQVILNAVRCFSSNMIASYPIPKKNLIDSRRRLVDNYFRDFDKPISSKELSKIIGTSVRQLDRIILDYYSMTFSEKLVKIRLEHAQKLLRQTSLPLRIIAEKTGFLSDDSLNRAFRKAFGITPKKFR